MKRIIITTCLFIFLTLAFYGCSSGRTHSFKDEIVPPSCTESGYTVHRCACGDEYKDTYVEPAGHDYIVSETREAACIEEGLITYICARCGDTYTETSKAAGHEVNNAAYELSKSDKGYALTCSGVCGVCGETVIETAAFFGCGLNFENENDSYTLGVANEGGGITVSLDGDMITFAAAPKNYFRFKGWSDGEQSSSRTLSVREAQSLDAVFGYDCHSMPVMNIDTGGEEVVALDHYVNCKVTLTNCGGEYLINCEEAGIRVRGNASANYGNADWIRDNKVHYRLKFDNKRSVLGINDGAKCKSWVLLRGDYSFIKEPVSFFMGQKLLGDDYFVSDYTYAEVYINYEYMGVYIICDQIQVNPYRVDIDEQKDGENYLKTGYLMEIDHYYAKEPYYFMIDYGNIRLTDMYGASYKTPTVGYSLKNENLTAEQLNFIKNYVSNAYKIVYEAIWKQNYLKFDANYNLVAAPEFISSEQAVGDVMDIESLIGMYILHELCEERDVGVGSFFLYVDFAAEKPLITFCAPWDFSWAFGDDTGFRYDKFSTSAWQPTQFIDYAGNRSSTWFITLYRAGWFVDKVKAKWAEASEKGWFDAMFEEIDRIGSEYKAEFEKNDARWQSGNQKYSSGSIAVWLKKRIKWLNTQWLEN